ncbi:hypothetical protein GX48_04220 [Paracoccidioides brasiliensis]|nr:hypothetical protein GX48_04220 [Paracoccidioides brasiliensis]
MGKIKTGELVQIQSAGSAVVRHSVCEPGQNRRGRVEKGGSWVWTGLRRRASIALFGWQDEAGASRGATAEPSSGGASDRERRTWGESGARGRAGLQLGRRRRRRRRRRKKKRPRANVGGLERRESPLASQGSFCLSQRYHIRVTCTGTCAYLVLAVLEGWGKCQGTGSRARPG